MGWYTEHDFFEDDHKGAEIYQYMIDHLVLHKDSLSFQEAMAKGRLALIEPSQAQISRETGYSKSTVKLRLKRWVEAGILKKTDIRSEENNRLHYAIGVWKTEKKVYSFLYKLFEFKNKSVTELLTEAVEILKPVPVIFDDSWE